MNDKYWILSTIYYIVILNPYTYDNNYIMSITYLIDSTEYDLDVA